MEGEIPKKSVLRRGMESRMGAEESTFLNSSSRVRSVSNGIMYESCDCSTKRVSESESPAERRSSSGTAIEGDLKIYCFNTKMREKRSPLSYK